MGINVGAVEKEAIAFVNKLGDKPDQKLILKALFEHTKAIKDMEKEFYFLNAAKVHLENKGLNSPAYAKIHSDIMRRLKYLKEQLVVFENT